MVGFAFIRSVGPSNLGDITWGTYWMQASSLIGIILTTSTAVRALFVAQASSDKDAVAGAPAAAAAAAAVNAGRCKAAVNAGDDSNNSGDGCC
jgi:hypothetical protein